MLDATNDKKLTSSYTYADSLRDSVEGKTYTTTKLYTETIGDTTYKYTYDTYGNITKIQKVNADNTEKTLYTYIYDEYNQLSSVNDQIEKTYTIYSYDESGNITRKHVQNLHPTYGYPIGDQCDITYTYGDSEWKDLLTSYNGQTLTYDAIGNPLNYRDGITFTWQNGRQLASYSDATQNITYTYDASGLRTGKVVTNSSNATIQYTYVYENNLLQKMTRGSRTFEFSYDAYGNPVSLAYRSNATSEPTYYYYALNSRGDVIALYDSTGNLYATYSYDAYGKFLAVKNASGVEITGNTSVAILNPLRYRGYVYDTETGFYYLQTRYYDPTACRFVNGDAEYISTGQDITGNNMFAYCGNNPIIRVDSEGNLWWIAKAVVGAVVGFVDSAVSTWSTGGDFKEGIISGCFGAVGGAAKALCPSPVISKGIDICMSGLESVTMDLIDGKSTDEILINAGVSMGFAALSGDDYFGSKAFDDDIVTIKQSKKLLKSGNHPAVKKSAQKSINQAKKTIIKQAKSQVSDSVVKSIACKGVQDYTKVSIRLLQIEGLI